MAKRKLPPEIREFFAREGAKGGRIGGKKRFAAMTAKQRTELARKAAAARWGKRKPELGAGATPTRTVAGIAKPANYEDNNHLAEHFPSDLQAQVEALTPLQRNVVGLVFVLGCTQAEAATRLHCSQQNVAKALRCALESLRKKIS